MTVKEFYKFDVPTWAICPIAYGDYSSLSGGDIRSLESFLEDIPSGGCWDFHDDSGFTFHNDIDNFSGDTLTAIYTIFE